ncbi:MAG TPA: hypothetical protein VMR41_01670 [Patescibacteria group bacterium]|nr:hypothetical protein [Patescibacteria group bacterium]
MNKSHNVFESNSVFRQFEEYVHRQIIALKPEEIQIFSEDLVLENYSIIIRPDKELLSIIEKHIAELRIIDPKQFYYPLEQLHLTILGNIAISVDESKLVAIIEQIKKQYNFEFLLKGFGSNMHTASIFAYPQFALHDLREQLRKELNVSGDYTNPFFKGFEYTGWINFIRYKQIPSLKLIEKLRNIMAEEIGIMKSTQIELYRSSSKTFNPEHAKLLQSFNL